MRDFIFFSSKITADGDYSNEIKRHLFLGRKVMTNLDSILKSRDITLPTNISLIKALVSSSSHVWMWELNYKESWAPKNWYFWTVVLENTLESPLDCKEIQPVHPKGEQSWVFIGGTDVEAETPIHWPPNEWPKYWVNKELTHLKRPWLKVGGEEDDRGWDFRWLHHLWIWVWVNPRSWWWTGKPSVLRFMGSQRVEHDWATELN